MSSRTDSRPRRPERRARHARPPAHSASHSPAHSTAHEPAKAPDPNAERSALLLVGGIHGQRGEEILAVDLNPTNIRRYLEWLDLGRSVEEPVLMRTTAVRKFDHHDLARSSNPYRSLGALAVVHRDDTFLVAPEAFDRTGKTRPAAACGVRVHGNRIQWSPDPDTEDARRRWSKPVTRGELLRALLWCGKEKDLPDTMAALVEADPHMAAAVLEHGVRVPGAESPHRDVAEVVPAFAVRPLVKHEDPAVRHVAQRQLNRTPQRARPPQPIGAPKRRVR